MPNCSAITIGAVVGQHHAAGADTNRLGAPCDVADQHGGRSARDPWHIVVFGEPVAAIAEVARRFWARSRLFLEGFGGAATLGDG